jgi:cytochrome P450
VRDTRQVDIDLTDPMTFHDRDLVALWREIRAKRPVWWHEPPGRPGFWALSRYEDVFAVYRDNTRFTSEGGTILTTMLAGGDSAAGKMLAVTDGRRHRQIRTEMLKSFSPRVLADVEAKVTARAAGLVKAAASQHEVDFATDVAEHIPMATICDLMSIPDDDRPDLLAWNKAALSADSADSTELDALTARNEILFYFADLAAARRRDPGTDVISRLATTTLDGRPLSEEEIVLNCYSLIIGGDESSRMSAIGAVLALAGNPAEWELLRADQSVVDSAVEEVLRWVTPPMHFGRRAVTDVGIGGHTIRAGDIVTLWNTSANFDETVFEQPERFRVTRAPNRHLAFGHGPHFCLGAYLGRVELKALLTALRQHVGRITLTGRPQRVFSNFLNGHSSLPVAFSPA